MEFRRELEMLVPRLRACALKLTRNYDLAEELLQDTCLRALDKQNMYQDGTNLWAWTSTMMHRLHITQSRTKQRHNRFHDTDRDTTPEAAVDCNEQFVHVIFEDAMSAFDALPAQQRMALKLVGAQGYTYEDAARVSGTAPDAVRWHVKSGRKRLAAHNPADL